MRKEKASQVLEVMRKFKIMPISVQQRVLAVHPKTGELRTAKILTAAALNSSNEGETLRYRAQFDRSELGVPYISDSHLIPINSQGANWDLFKTKREAAAKGGVGSSPLPASSGNDQENRGEHASGLSLANEIRN